MTDKNEQFIEALRSLRDATLAFAHSNHPDDEHRLHLAEERVMHLAHEPVASELEGLAELVLEKYQDKPDDFPLSLGH